MIGGMTENQRELVKIRIFGNDSEIVVASVAPDSTIVSAVEADEFYLRGTREDRRELVQQPKGKILIQQQHQLGAIVVS